MLDFPQLVNECAVEMAPSILERIVSVESSFNPWAIGVVGGRLARQPVSRMEAVATANIYTAQGGIFPWGWGRLIGIISASTASIIIPFLSPAIIFASPPVYSVNACSVPDCRYLRNRRRRPRSPAITVAIFVEDSSPKAVTSKAMSTALWRSTQP